MSDEFYMDLAIKKAWEYQILTYPNPAVGCVILGKSGEILAIEAHRKAGLAHAELNASINALFKLKPELKEKFISLYELNFDIKFQDIHSSNANFIYDFIYEYHRDALTGAKVYITLEPCSHAGKTKSCAKLLKELKVSEVIIARKDESIIAGGGVKILENAGIRVKTGILKDRADELIEPFLIWQRRNFSFFKLGMSVNGVIKGGVITNLEARKMVHSLRSVIDLLVVGGNTVRTDRPTLDTRLICGKDEDLKDGEFWGENGGENFSKNLENFAFNSTDDSFNGAKSGEILDQNFPDLNQNESQKIKNPDVFIYSKQRDFDKTIPLFGVKNRKVMISSDIDLVRISRLAMFEGGENALKSMPNFITHMLIFFSPNFINLESLKLDLNLKLLFVGEISGNFYGWFRIC